ncbi:MT-A70 family methyltransferase [Methylosinus sp.]|jgi:N6-adenosine-specific RNA methylase IME4|uniref:MT-A70 family methyltransferase n=1 Tax=Methylosinus sp. TaxID=427 RepID=UPI002F926634
MSEWPFGDDIMPFQWDVVVMDAPTPFETRSAKGQEKSPQAQYDCMTLGEICAMPVGDLLAPGGVLIFWTTWPLAAKGFHVEAMTRYGVPPVTGGAWVKRTATGKLRWGPGYVLRSVCEPYFVGRLPGADMPGSPRTINLVESLHEHGSIDGLAREHSRKPEEFYQMVEALSPDARRLDVFSRQSRPGWATWGKEADKFDGGQAA